MGVVGLAELDKSTKQVLIQDILLGSLVQICLKLVNLPVAYITHF